MCQNRFLPIGHISHGSVLSPLCLEPHPRWFSIVPGRMFVYQKSMLAERGNFFLLKIKGDRTEEGRSNEKEVSIAQQVRQRQLASDEGITSFLHVEDAARATQLALDWPPGILDDEPAPGTVWLPVYAATLGVPVLPMTAGQPHATRGATNRKAR